MLNIVSSQIRAVTKYIEIGQKQDEIPNKRKTMKNAFLEKNKIISASLFAQLLKNGSNIMNI